jgi:nucleoside-diphosphate-sugar epimerase
MATTRGTIRMTQTVLITGAGGFVGGTIVEALHFGEQYEVHAGLVRWLSAPRVARLPVTLVQCDVMKPATLNSTFADVDYVIHCAVGDDEVIVEGTKNVLRAAATAGVKRVVYLSSVAIYGEATGSIDEDTAPGALTPYGAAKRAAEAICRDAAGVEVVVLRPSIIYGPFSANWTMMYATRLKTGRWKQLGGLGTGKCNLVHVHDVARYAIAALRCDGIVGETFNVNGPEIVSWNEYIERFNYHLGLSALASQTSNQTRMQTHTVGVVRAVGKYALKHYKPQLRWLSEKSDKLKRVMEQTELTIRLTPSQDELKLFGLDAYYCTSKAERSFGLKPMVDIDAGLGNSVAWLNHIGM